jgi:hypothetical protein
MPPCRASQSPAIPRGTGHDVSTAWALTISSAPPQGKLSRGRTASAGSPDRRGSPRAPGRSPRARAPATRSGPRSAGGAAPASRSPGAGVVAGGVVVDARVLGPISQRLGQDLDRAGDVAGLRRVPSARTASPADPPRTATGRVGGVGAHAERRVAERPAHGPPPVVRERPAVELVEAQRSGGGPDHRRVPNVDACAERARPIARRARPAPPPGRTVPVRSPGVQVDRSRAAGVWLLRQAECARANRPCRRCSRGRARSRAFRAGTRLRANASEGVPAVDKHGPARVDVPGAFYAELLEREVEGVGKPQPVLFLAREHLDELSAVAQQSLQLRVVDRGGHEQSSTRACSTAAGPNRQPPLRVRAVSVQRLEQPLVGRRAGESGGRRVQPALHPKSARRSAPGSTSRPSTRAVGEPRNRSRSAAPSSACAGPRCRRRGHGGGAAHAGATPTRRGLGSRRGTGARSSWRSWVRGRRPTHARRLERGRGRRSGVGMAPVS